MSNDKEAHMRSTRTRTLLLTAALLSLAACRHDLTPTAGPSPPSPAPNVSSGMPESPAPSGSTVIASPYPVASAGWVVVSGRTAIDWGLPGKPYVGVQVAHNAAVPPVPQLVTIGAGDHPSDAGQRPFNRMTFSFTSGFPSYTVMYVPKLQAEGTGQTIPLPGASVLQIAFGPAQAHTDSGAPSVQSRPDPNLGMVRMLAYAQSGDYEGVVGFGIGVGAQAPIRAYEATYYNSTLDQYRYVVALDVDVT